MRNRGSERRGREGGIERGMKRGWRETEVGEGGVSGEERDKEGGTGREKQMDRKREGDREGEGRGGGKGGRGGNCTKVLAMLLS